MTHEELAAITNEFVGREKKLMAQELGLPYRTFQDYLYGKRRIPEAVANAALALIADDRAFMAGIPSRVDEELLRTHPLGLMSAPVDVW